MKKNRFKKLFVLALSTICLLANGATHAMNSEDDLTKTTFGSSLQRSQVNPNYALQLSQILSISLEKAQELANLNQQYPDDFARTFGASGLGNSSLFGSSIGLSPQEREMKRLIGNGEGVALFPPLDPFKIMHLINEVLLPKYASVLQGGFAKRTLDISEGDFDDVLDFLKTNKSFIMSDLCSPHPMIMLLKMITQDLDSTLLTSQMQPHYYGFQPLSVSEMLLKDCAGIINRQFVVKMDVFYQVLKQSINAQYFHGGGMGQDQQQLKEKTLNEIKKDLNKKLSYPGFEFDIEVDAKEVSKTIENWVKVVRQLVSFELREWEGKEASYRQLQECYDFASQQLLATQSNQTLYFSGVVKTPYTIGLIQVEKETQASSLDFISKLVETHKKTDEKKLNEYNDIKDELSSLKKLKNWFDTFLGEVSKNGKIS